MNNETEKTKDLTKLKDNDFKKMVGELVYDSKNDIWATVTDVYISIEDGKVAGIETLETDGEYFEFNHYFGWDLSSTNFYCKGKKGKGKHGKQQK